MYATCAFGVDLGRDSEIAPTECKRRNELRDYERHLLGFASTTQPTGYVSGLKSSPYNVRGAMNCATTNVICWVSQALPNLRVMCRA